jgi:hypothetical protein
MCHKGQQPAAQLGLDIVLDIAGQRHGPDASFPGRSVGGETNEALRFELTGEM